MIKIVAAFLVLAGGIAGAAAAQQLAELEEHLDRYVAGVTSAIPEAGACFKADQAQWLKTTRAACKDDSCLRTAYLNRLAELHPLQPGVTAIRSFTLPSVPALVWIIPPEPDKVAAPNNPRAKPFEATGAIASEIDTGSQQGLVLRMPDGTVYPLVALMFFGSDTTTRLSLLGKEPGAVFRARGHLATSPDGTRFFEPSRCTFIHRLAQKPLTQKPAKEPDDLKEIEAVRLRVVTQGNVCPDPARPCPGFEANELSFAIGTPFTFDRGRDKSLPFYAVILQSAPLCRITEKQRLQAQSEFPARKVFVHQYFCQDFADNVTYSNVNEKAGFMAVYAGETDAEAKTLLAEIQAGGRFPGANLRRMEAIVVYQLE